MQNRQLRGLFGLVAIAAATAVGVTTHDAGFTALTFVGALVVPRILGIGGRHRRGFSCGAGGHRDPGGRAPMRDRFEQRLDSWHTQAHGDIPIDPSAASRPASA
ncbi:MAG: hypothetical protein ACHQ06_00250 [Candidatus Dormibacteria bacterium]|jgi:hypothetical protein